jgi:hydroxymethylpyrimidine kinase/phosphomethylpyrimidine kinase
MTPDCSVPVAWTVAGSDPGAGAGIQADLKVMHALGVYGCTLLTGLTAQNTCGVSEMQPVPTAFLRAQWEALRNDLPPRALKTGMLGSAENVRLLGELLPQLSCPVVCDPIRHASSGCALLEDGRNELMEHLLPQITLLTPNRPELQWLLGEEAAASEQTAAEMLLERSVRAVLIKGGHLPGSTARDYWFDGRRACWLESPRVQTTSTHGTGCILSAAITAFLALEYDLFDAVVHAKAFMNRALASPLNLGAGRGPMHIAPMPEDYACYLPKILDVPIGG